MPWRARALLKPWWDAGATVTGLLHALEYHPDRPEIRRGDLTSGARDPLRIIGARLRPWRGRLGEIRAVQIGRMRASTSAQPTAKLEPARLDPALLDRPAGRGARRAPQEALSEHLRHLREARGTQHSHHPTQTVLPRRLRRPRVKQ
ncbi:hypothetical protein ACLFMI_26205 [Pseudonocardia nantongensis]|uniref:hypothetical protein n=1 Tax=Pseudonocardia nantongensis TaxID=1181885 RepID=UPI0039794940